MKLYLYSSTKYLIPLAVLAGGWIYLFGAHLPYVNTDPIKLAEYLARHGRSPEECWDLVVLDPFGPQAAVSRAGCIHKYAEVMKDPAACELLMPSRYGLDCVGGAKSTDDVCHFYNGDENVYWDEAGDAFGKTTIKSCQKIDRVASDMRSKCCVIARVTFVKSENDCSGVKNDPSMYDQCLQNLAFKNHDPDVCSGIANDNTKTACRVNAEAIAKNPGICSGCKERVETLDLLK